MDSAPDPSAARPGRGEPVPTGQVPAGGDEPYVPYQPGGLDEPARRGGASPAPGAGPAGGPVGGSAGGSTVTGGRSRRGATDGERPIEEHRRTGVAGSTWVALILGAVVLVLLLVFILQNNVPADFSYLGWSFELPLGVAMLFATVAGVVGMGLFGSILLLRYARRVRRLEKEIGVLRQGTR